jgi:hypothetical protein
MEYLDVNQFPQNSGMQLMFQLNDVSVSNVNEMCSAFPMVVHQHIYLIKSTTTDFQQTAIVSSINQLVEMLKFIIASKPSLQQSTTPNSGFQFIDFEGAHQLITFADESSPLIVKYMRAHLRFKGAQVSPNNFMMLKYPLSF